MICIKCKKEIPEAALFCPWCGAPQQQKDRTPHARSRGNGTGTVYKRGRTWTARVVLGWKDDAFKRPVYAYKGGFATKREAVEYIPKLFGEKEARKTLAQYWELWERDNLPSLSDSKQTAYRIAYRKLGNLVYRDISTITVSDLRNTVGESAPSYYPARDMKTLLTHLYRLAGADQIANALLPSFIVLPPLQEAEQQPFNNDELKALWVAYEAGDTFVGYILLMIYSGMMPGELLALRKPMIDLQAQRITGAGMKTKERRKTDIMIADLMVPVVASLMDYSQGSKLLTMNKDNFYKQYYDALNRCACRHLPPYSCRHTTATALSIGQNIAPAVIRKVMHWSSTKMLDRYAHASQEDALTAVNAISTDDILITDAQRNVDI